MFVKRDLLDSRLFYAVASLAFTQMSCTPHQAVREQPAPEVGASVAEPADSAPSSEPPVASAAPHTLTPSERQRLDRFTARARGVLMATSNLDPRPIDRVPGSPPWVAFRSSRRSASLGDLSWFEAPSDSPSEMPVASTGATPLRCTHTISAGGSLSTPAIDLVRSADHDEVIVGAGSKSKHVTLPRGAIEGDACIVGSGKSAALWLAWSTPDHPADLFSIAISSGKVRPLRLEGRPGLGGLIEQTSRTTDGTDALPALAHLDPKVTEVAASPSVLLFRSSSPSTPLARWSGLARFLSASGIHVVIAADHPSSHLAPNGSASSLKPMLDAIDAHRETRTIVLIESECASLSRDTIAASLREIDRSLEVVCTKSDVDEQAKEWARAATQLLPSPR